MSNPYRNNITFQNHLHFSPFLPPPPPPPNILCPLIPESSDQDYMKTFEKNLPKVAKIKPTKVSISLLMHKITELTVAYYDIRKQQYKLVENINTYSEEEWQSALESISCNKNVIESILGKLSGSYLYLSRKYVAKRSAKRLRLKQVKQERKEMQDEKLKILEERSRTIDENLKKINDDIQKAKQEEETKLQADLVLKDVRRKKLEAKKNINKLCALVKLRTARLNTCKGRGESVSQVENDNFQEHIEKLKLMWTEKLSMYETEETELKVKLGENSKQEEAAEREDQMLNNLGEWHRVMFGGADGPQVDFQGDIQKFITVRSEWDQYIDSTGSPLPLQWVLPEHEQGT